MGDLIAEMVGAVLAGLGWPADPREATGWRKAACVAAVTLLPVLIAFGMIVLAVAVS